jgi:hypothetical protein
MSAAWRDGTLEVVPPMHYSNPDIGIYSSDGALKVVHSIWMHHFDVKVRAGGRDGAVGWCIKGVLILE